MSNFEQLKEYCQKQVNNHNKKWGNAIGSFNIEKRISQSRAQAFQDVIDKIDQLNQKDSCIKYEVDVA